MNQFVRSFAVSGTSLFAGAFGRNVFLSTNYGASWTWVGSGLVDAWDYSLAVNGTNLFLGTGGEGVWRPPLSEMITGVEAEKDGSPFHFTLGQNYPNPFSPRTTIEFSLPHAGNVTMKVYDLLGEEIATLAHGTTMPVGLESNRMQTHWRQVFISTDFEPEPFCRQNDSSF